MTANGIGQEIGSIFDRIYIVNLPSRADRRREMADQLDRIGLALDRHPVQLFDAVRPDEAGEWPSVGARGCFMSHLGILRAARAEGLSAILILEDDADWSRSFLATPAAFLDPLRQRSWGFMHAGESEAVKARPVAIQRVDPGTALPNTHCIALRGDAIARCVDYLEAMAARRGGDPAGGPMHVDGAYSWFRRDNPDVETITFTPSMAFQRSSESDITRGSGAINLPFAGAILRFARRLRSRL